MAWSIYLELGLVVPAASWPALVETTPAAQPIPVGWWGLASTDIEAALSPEYCDSMTAASALRAFEELGSRVFRIEAGPDRVDVRVCVQLDDRGEPYLAKPIAALVEAAKATAATGSVAIVRDGGDDGVVLTLAGGSLRRTQIADAAARAAALADEIFGSAPFEDDLEPPPVKPKKSAPRKKKT
jgi:hypothetical protein